MLKNEWGASTYPLVPGYVSHLYYYTSIYITQYIYIYILSNVCLFSRRVNEHKYHFFSLTIRASEINISIKQFLQCQNLHSICSLHVNKSLSIKRIEWI